MVLPAVLRDPALDRVRAAVHAAGFLGWFGISAKLAGVLAMFGSIALLFVLPWLDTSKVRSATFRPIYKWLFWLLVIDCVVLTWVRRPAAGQRIVVWIGQFATLYYFVHFLVLLPLLGKLERPLPCRPASTGPCSARLGLTAQPAE